VTKQNSRRSIDLSIAHAEVASRERDQNYDLVESGARICEPILREDINLRERYGGYLCTWIGSVR
jgi:hypothetical protein